MLRLSLRFVASLILVFGLADNAEFCLRAVVRWSGRADER